jgi:hypothetical protein
MMDIKQIERARTALRDMDDFARMSCGVDAFGPRKVLEDFITAVAGAAEVQKVCPYCGSIDGTHDASYPHPRVATAPAVEVPEAAQQNGGLVRAALIELLSPALERAASSGAVSFDYQSEIATIFARGRQALAQSAFDAAPECCGSTEHCERSTCPAPLMEVSAVCPQCNGTGMVSDGETNAYPDGTPYMHGPVKHVKDCPACSLPAPGSIEALQRYGECSTRPGVMRDRKGEYILRSEAVAWADMVKKCSASDQAEFNRKWTEQKTRADKAEDERDENHKLLMQYKREADALWKRVNSGEAAFKNFHRSLCARFGYVHDEVDWKRDQVSLEEHIAAKVQPAAQHDIVKDAVNRFLGWKLPKDFGPDCGISFDGRKDDEFNKNKSWPIGTNLLTADQAKAMFEHCLLVKKGGV